MVLKEIKDDELSDHDERGHPPPQPPESSSASPAGKVEPKESEAAKEDKDNAKSATEKKPSSKGKTKSAAEKKKAKAKAKGTTKKKSSPDGEPADAKPNPMKKPAAAPKTKQLKRPAAASESGEKTVVSAHRKYYNRDNTTGILVKYSDGSQQQMLVAWGSVSKQNLNRLPKFACVFCHVLPLPTYEGMKSFAIRSNRWTASQQTRCRRLWSLCGNEHSNPTWSKRYRFH